MCVNEKLVNFIFHRHTHMHRNIWVCACVLNLSLMVLNYAANSMCIVSQALLTEESNKRRKLQRISYGCGLNSHMRLNDWTTDSILETVMTRHHCSGVFLQDWLHQVIFPWYQRPWSRRAFKSEDVVSGLTWREMRPVKSTCTRHATHELLGFP